MLAVIFASLVALNSPTTAAENKKKTPEPERSESAALRLWKGDFASQRLIRVNRRATGRKGAVAESVDFSEGYRFGDYVPVPAGAWTFEVVDSKDPATRLAFLSASLVPGSFATLLVREKPNVVTLELLDDTAPKNEIAELVVRNFAPNLKFVNIDAGADLHTRLFSIDGFLIVRGLARAKLQVETTGEEITGQTLKWSNEVDFTKVRRATVLIYPDAYGRIRPRVIVDGEMMTAPADCTQETPPIKN